jgi:intracellular sulfur oxidation DsrE/DsrF family protein
MTLRTVEHLLVETKASGDAFLRGARVLAGTGHRVVVLLIQDAVGAVFGASALIGQLTGAGVQVLVDDFSMRQHAVADVDLPAGVDVVDADEIAGSLLVPGVKVVWH